jgi:hypothetical protein
LERQKTWKPILVKIAHRGNTSGPSKLENSPEYIQAALDAGYDAEVDVWVINDKFYLGHDSPEYSVDYDWLEARISSLWIHCKNLDALQTFSECEDLFNFFWHQEDDFTLTSWGFIWTYPGKDVRENSVIVDLDGDNNYDCYGLCSDYLV